MRLTRSFVNSLMDDWNLIPPQIQKEFGTLISQQDVISALSNTDDQILHDLEFLSSQEINDIHTHKTDTQVGLDAIRSGKVLNVVLAGGTAFDGSAVALQRVGLSNAVSLSLKLLQSKHVDSLSRVTEIPTCIMTSTKHFMPIANHLATLGTMQEITLFDQRDSLCFSPDNMMIFETPLSPKLYPVGTGDVAYSLLNSDILSEYPNVEYVAISNIENICSELNERVLSVHIHEGREATYELTHTSFNDSMRSALAMHTNNSNSNVLIRTDQISEQQLKTIDLFANENVIINVAALKKCANVQLYKKRIHVQNQIFNTFQCDISQYTNVLNCTFVKTTDRYCNLGAL